MLSNRSGEGRETSRVSWLRGVIPLSPVTFAVCTGDNHAELTTAPLAAEHACSLRIHARFTHAWCTHAAGADGVRSSRVVSYPRSPLCPTALRAADLVEQSV